MDIDLKPIRWLGTTRDDIRAQRPATRYELGQQLFRLQMGLMPNNYKPINTVGPGAYEVRVRDADGIAWLLFDREDASANTLSAEVLAEFGSVLAALESERPTGLVIRSAKASGFIAGADVNEFRGATDPGPSRRKSAGRMR